MHFKSIDCDDVATPWMSTFTWSFHFGFSFSSFSSCCGDLFFVSFYIAVAVVAACCFVVDADRCVQLRQPRRS